MKETKKSLKIYLIIVGVLGVLSSMGHITTITDILIKGVYIITSLMFIFYGVKFYSYLENSPKTLINFIIISLSVRIIFGLFWGQWGILILVLLGWYLIHNIKKLSAQPSI